jgi:hypothetical protein
MREGALRFVWTDGATDYKIYMIPNGGFRFDFPIESESRRWYEPGMVIVAIERVGCFHFNLFHGDTPFGEDYVHEKLNLPMEPAGKIAELFNMMRDALSGGASPPGKKNVLV